MPSQFSAKSCVSCNRGKNSDLAYLPKPGKKTHKGQGISIFQREISSFSHGKIENPWKVEVYKLALNKLLHVFCVKSQISLSLTRAFGDFFGDASGGDIIIVWLAPLVATDPRLLYRKLCCSRM
jgi:hypothetical protein